eukprot:530994_1
MTHVVVNSLSQEHNETLILQSNNKYEQDDEKYLINTPPSNEKYEKKSLSNSQKAKKCCSSIMKIILSPFLLITIFLSYTTTVNIICSIISCILVALSTSSSRKSMNQSITLLYMSFIIRNLIYIIILSHYKYAFNKLRLFYNITTNLTIISLTINDIQNVSDYNDYDLYHILLICMSLITILCHLWLISSFTFKPNKLYDNYFEINQELLSNLRYVGKHASEIQLDEISLCVIEMKRIYKSNITRIICNRKEQLKNLLRMVQENEYNIIAALKSDLGRGDLMAVSYEIYPIISEIKMFLQNIDEWCAPESMGWSLSTFPSSNYHIMEPYGTVFINGIWNFPIQLSLTPIIGAICSGNN